MFIFLSHKSISSNWKSISALFFPGFACYNTPTTQRAACKSASSNSQTCSITCSALSALWLLKTNQTAQHLRFPLWRYIYDYDEEPEEVHGWLRPHDRRDRSQRLINANTMITTKGLSTFRRPVHYKLNSGGYDLWLWWKIWRSLWLTTAAWSQS